MPSPHLKIKPPPLTIETRIQEMTSEKNQNIENYDEYSFSLFFHLLFGCPTANNMGEKTSLAC